MGEVEQTRITLSTTALLDEDVTLSQRLRSDTSKTEVAAAAAATPGGAGILVGGGGGR